MLLFHHDDQLNSLAIGVLAPENLAPCRISPSAEHFLTHPDIGRFFTIQLVMTRFVSVGSTMQERRILSAAEQVAEFIREDILRGTWGDELPGQEYFSKRMGIGKDTIQRAFQLLEKQGLVVPRGSGRRRRIHLPEDHAPVSLHIRILLYEKDGRTVAPVHVIRHRAELNGHVVEFADKDLHDLKMDPTRIARYVSKNPADAWVINAGSREVLDWFSQQDFPAFALFGNAEGINMAGTGANHLKVVEQYVDQLVGLGHQRIVMLVREERRKHGPGPTERGFLARLALHGIETGTYNLPDWEERPEALQACIESLFKLTPPTAIIIDEPPFYFAVNEHLHRMDVRVPEQVSLVCIGEDPAFLWTRPKVSHTKIDDQPITRATLRWIDDIAKGKDNLRKIIVQPQTVNGETIGPA